MNKAAYLSRQADLYSGLQSSISSDGDLLHSARDNIKVDVTDLYDNFGQAEVYPIKTTHQYQLQLEDSPNTDSPVPGGMATICRVPLAPLELPSPSFSSCDLEGLVASVEENVISQRGQIGRAPLVPQQETVAASTQHQTSAFLLGSAPSVFKHPRQSGKHSHLGNAQQQSIIRRDGLHLGAVAVESAEGFDSIGPLSRSRVLYDTYQSGLVVSEAPSSLKVLVPSTTVISNMHTSFQAEETPLDLPSWELAPMSPPIEVKDVNHQSSLLSTTMASVITTKGNASKYPPANGTNNSSGITFVTTAVSSAGATLNGSSLKVQQKPSSSQQGDTPTHFQDEKRNWHDTPSYSTSVPSRYSSTTESELGRMNSVASLRRNSSACPTIKRTPSTSGSQSAREGEGLEGMVAGKIVFPDLSLRPVPLKSYRTRKLTRAERNDSYAQACHDFAKARTGLNVWILRFATQEPPALLKEPPVKVKAVSGMFAATSKPNAQTTLKPTAAGNTTPTTPKHTLNGVSSVGGQSIGARVKRTGKRFSTDLSNGVHGSISSSVDAHSSSDTVGLHATEPHFYKQSSAKSAIELGSWSPGRIGEISSSMPGRSQFSFSTQSTGSHAQGTAMSDQSGNGPETLTPLSRRADPNTGFAGELYTNNSHWGVTRNRTLSDVQPSQSARLSVSGVVKDATTLAEDMAMRSVHDLTANSYPGSGMVTSTSVGSVANRSVSRSQSIQYSRRPISQAVGLNKGVLNGQATETTSRSSSRISLASQSTSSLGSLSAYSNTDMSSSPMPPITGHEERYTQQPSQTDALRDQNRQETHLVVNGTDQVGPGPKTFIGPPSIISNLAGYPIPLADEAASKEPYSPLTSPIMIPLGGFPESEKVSISALCRISASVGQAHAPARPSTNPVEVPQPSPAQISPSPLTGKSPVPDKGVKGVKRAIHRYSIGSFSMSQARLSKKMPKSESSGGSNQDQPVDQRYSVASETVAGASAQSNEYFSEQSLNALSDILPHVDRDRLAIYLQRARGDEMVAIGLAMSDLKTGKL
ncbi:hypothetical protein BGW38_010055 [Lunasporangiospora selenospora]|uniref:Uncharacterized protein n=1 Tax=Lunasporangiospora selenospora TaxID=979761 RepID=A0A9P6G299_9FUNG|nr:hypothetical protein BGW38_010055 [Lunasporangiospora selenospora]